MENIKPLIGTKLPDQVLEIFYQEQIKRINLADYRGQWLVLFFYPGDFTFICPTELKELAELYLEFKKVGAEIISVSMDSVYVHKAWHDQSEAIKTVLFPMATDHLGGLAKTLGVCLDEEGVALRASFIVDPDGAIKVIEINDNSIGRSASELLRKLRAAQFVASHSDQVCPASWQPGDKTLKPGLSLVGKI